MDSASLVATVRPAAEQLIAHARAAGLEAPVPSCPEWTTADLLKHVSRVHSWATRIIETAGPVNTRDLARPTDDTDLFAWAAEKADGVAKILSETDAAEPTWNWAGVEPSTVAFWHRRMAQETAMHAADAALAAGADPSAHFSPELAADGIDELLTVIAPLMVKDRLTGTLHIHCTDTDGEWLVETSGDGTLAVRREHAKGDAALRGPAAELFLRLNNRGTGGEVIGDAAVVESWSNLAKF